MLTQLSKRINHILQGQDYAMVETPRTQQRNIGSNDRSKLSIQQSGGYSSERKEKLPPRSNSKQHIPPKSAYDVLNNSAAKSDREPNDLPNKKRPSMKEPQSMSILPSNFIQIYKQQILSLIKPFITELQTKIHKRLQQIQKQIKSIIQTQKYEAMTLTQTPAFMSHSKSFNLSQDESEVSIILRKAQLIALKIEDNQLQITSKFRQIDDQIRQIRLKKPQKCNCMQHLQNLIQNQQSLYDQFQVLSNRIIHT